MYCLSVNRVKKNEPRPIDENLPRPASVQLVRFSNALEYLSGWNAVFDRPYDYVFF